MTSVLVLISAAFTAWRFTSPGHAVSASGSVEALAHVYMGVVLVLAWLKTLAWAHGRGWLTGIRPAVIDLDQPIVRPALAQWRGPLPSAPFPWLVHALWFVPSMVELVLFLQGPFNPKHQPEAPPQPEVVAVQPAPQVVTVIVDHGESPELRELELKVLASAEKFLTDHPCPRCGKATCGCVNCQCSKVPAPPDISNLEPYRPSPSIIYVDCGCCGNRPCRCGASCQCVIRSRP